MKIIDESKVMGKPNESSNFKLLRIIIYKNIKKIANNQKLLIMTKKNPFYIRKEVSKDRDLEKFFETWTNIKKKKIEKGEFEMIEFNNIDKKIKNLGYNATNISEINSVDPRLLLLWNYNEKIKITLHFKGSKLEWENRKEFTEDCPNFDISKEEHWRKFLYLFPTKENDPVPKLGIQSFKEELKSFPNEDSKFLNKFKDNQRQKNIDLLIKEMA